MRALSIVMLLPLAGCFWMVQEPQKDMSYLYKSVAPIRNPNAGRFYKVEKVLDGGAIKVSGYERPIQLLGVSQPGHSKTWNDYYTLDAYLYLKKLLEGKQVALYDDWFDELPFRVWNDRVLAYVYYRGRLVNRRLIDLGCARVQKRHSFHRRDEFLRAEEIARDRRVGLWAAFP